MAKKLFIDTNIFLAFYHFTNEDLEELKKLAHLLDQQEVDLHLPEQVIDEFRRNREVKIADSLKRLRGQTLNLQFPQMVKQYPEYDQLRQLQREYSTKHEALLEKLDEDIQQKSLLADDIISELFEQGVRQEISVEILERARRRVTIGNPPGKNSSHGDAINWESLLDTVPSRRVLYFISDDKDYSSPTDSRSFNGFLLDEWKELNGGRVEFYKSLSQFFRSNYPDINLADERAKDELIASLAHSGSFAKTHSIVAQLEEFPDFTVAQINAIASAAVSNSQVAWIANDPDVHAFLTRVVDENGKLVEDHLWKQIKDLFVDDSPDVQIVFEPPDDLPF